MIFVLVTFALTYGTAFLAPQSTSSLLSASMTYVVVVGWQPLVALWLVRDDARFIDPGRRVPELPFSAISIVGPLLLLATVAVLCGAEVSRDRQVDLGEALLGFGGVVSVLWLQAIAEEIAWRGYFLPRLMRELGAWPGLLVHGALWGLCYAPLFARAADAIQFVVTCALLGALLGWLRLASRSVYASATSNATLTICAGLPLALHGNGSPLAAVFAPIGWIPMVIAIAVIAVKARIGEPDVPGHVN